MLDLNKKYTKQYMIIIANYLIDRCEEDDYLREKLSTTEKTLEQCVDYIKEEAREQSMDGVAVIPDEEVFGWAVHYFLEDEIKESKPKQVKQKQSKLVENRKPEVNKEVKANKTKEVKKKLFEQISLFEI